MKTIFNFKDVTYTCVGRKKKTYTDIKSRDELVHYAVSMVNLGRSGGYDPQIEFTDPNDEVTQQCVKQIQSQTGGKR